MNYLDILKGQFKLINDSMVKAFGEEIQSPKDEPEFYEEDEGIEEYEKTLADEEEKKEEVKNHANSIARDIN